MKYLPTEERDMHDLCLRAIAYVRAFGGERFDDVAALHEGTNDPETEATELVLGLTAICYLLVTLLAEELGRIDDEVFDDLAASWPENR
jgi:hypothetical protein